MRRRSALLALFCTAAPAWADPTVPVPDGYRMDQYNAPVPDAVPGGKVIHTDGLHALIADPLVILVDVLPVPRRPEGMHIGMPWMPVPHRNLPGSLWLPEAGRGAPPPGVEDWFDRTLLAAAHGDRSRPIVIYCRADCWMSWNAARRAALHGWTHVLWYPDGPDSWAAAGLPLAPAQPAE